MEPDTESTLIETPDVSRACPRLGQAQIELLGRAGTSRATSAGEVLIQEGNFEVLQISGDDLRRVVLTDAAVGEIILRAYLQRRILLISAGAGIRVVGSRFSRDGQFPDGRGNSAAKAVRHR